MTQPIQATPRALATPAINMDCNVPDCEKLKKYGFKTNVGWTNHMKKWHQVAKDALSPLTTTARTLFKNVEDDGGASTQGNSRGEVNVVKVVSKAFNLCGICGKKYGNKKEMEEHMEQHGTTKDNDIPADGVDLEVEEPTFAVDEDLEIATIAEEIEN